MSSPCLLYIPCDIHPAWKNAFGGFLIHMVLGSLYLWGNITPVVTSYLRKYDDNLTYSDTIFVYITALLFNGISMLCQGSIENAIGPRGCVFVGGYLVVAASILSSFGTSVEYFVLTEGVMFGCGFGMAYTVPFSCAAKWMPARKGLLTGIVISGIGVGAAVFSAIATYFVNPHAVSPSVSGSKDGYYPPTHEVPAAVPNMYLFLGLLYFVFITTGALFICPFNEEKRKGLGLEDTSLESGPSGPHVAMEETASMLGSTVGLSLVKKRYQGQGAILQTQDSGGRSPPLSEDPQGADTSLCGPGSAVAEETHSLSPTATDSLPPLKNCDSMGVMEYGGLIKSEDINLAPMEMLFTKELYHVVLCFFLTTAGGLFIAGVFRTFGEAYFNNNDIFLTTVGSFASLFNTAGRVFWGSIGDRYGCMYTLIAMNVVFAFAYVTYSMSFTFGKVGYFLWTCAIFCFEGGNFSLYPALTMQLFGAKYSGSNYGIVFAIVNSSTVLAIAVASKCDLAFPILSKLLGGMTLTGVSCLLFLPKTSLVMTKKT